MACQTFFLFLQLPDFLFLLPDSFVGLVFSRRELTLERVGILVAYFRLDGVFLGADVSLGITQQGDGSFKCLFFLLLLFTEVLRFRLFGLQPGVGIGFPELGLAEFAS